MSNKFKTTVIFKESSADVLDYIEDDINYAEDDINYAEDEGAALRWDDETSFSEAVGTDDLESVTLEDVLTPFVEGDDSLEETAEYFEEAHEEIKDIIKTDGERPLSDFLPGSNTAMSEFEEEDEVKDTDYVNDGDLSKFMEYVNSQYPGNIPQHDGRSTVGCERAVSFLDRLNSDISRAIRDDHESLLDIGALEGVRVNIMRDVLVLKEHLNKLKKQIKDGHGKEASLDSNGIPKWKTSSGKNVEYKDLTKEAGTPNNMVIAVSPFERAISGIMINAHISSGHPMEDVYGFLAKKYSIDDREELAIMQLCMDSGFHIFKDRGTYSPYDADDKKQEGKSGVDFVRNYFA